VYGLYSKHVKLIVRCRWVVLYADCGYVVWCL